MPRDRVARSKPSSLTDDLEASSMRRKLLDQRDKRALALCDLYMCYCLDFIIDIAQAIAVQAVRNPLTYRTSGNYLIFHSARAELGANVDWLTPAQRADVYGSVFGSHPLGGAAGESSMPFDTAGAAVRNAASDVAAAVYGPSSEALLQVLELEAQNFKTAVLEPWPEPILSAIAKVARQNIERAAAILRDDGVSTAFRVERIAAKDWPMEVDAAGSLLVAATSGELGAEGNPPMDSALFTNLQRVAQAGCQTLMVLGAYPNADPESPIADDQPLRALLASALSWQRSTRRMQRSVGGI